MQRQFGVPKAQAEEHTRSLLEGVGLDRSYYYKFPKQMSGGECQRSAIARALSVSPDIILCDEITSALDVSVQAQVVELLQKIHDDIDISILFISHDLALVGSLCSRVLVMHDGVFVEQGDPMEIIKNPKDDYTRNLVSSIFTV